MSNEERRLAEQIHRLVDDLRNVAKEQRELIHLLNLYGTRILDDDWHPTAPDEWLPEEEARRLKMLLAKL
jgi:hypothetical protein